MSKDVHKKIKDTYVRVFGSKSKKEIKEERTWCCFTLSEYEVLKAIRDNCSVSLNTTFIESPDTKERFIKDVVDRFKDCVLDMASEWENELGGCVNDTIEQWNDTEEE